MRNFKPSEFNHLDRMDSDFLNKVDRFRSWHGFPTLITSDWRDSATSAHGRGVALDMVLFLPRYWRTKQPSWFTIWQIAHQYGFRGIGVYFDWKVDGKPVIGLHVDDSDDDSRRPLSWVRISGRYYYFRSHKGTFIAPDGRELNFIDLFSLSL